MELSPDQLLAIRWPHPWKPLTDGDESLLPAVISGEASTIIEELNREMCDTHPLQDVKCVPVAYDNRTCKEYLLSTDMLDSPFVLVHLTFTKESDPRWPFIIRYRSMNHFLASERYINRRWWQFWIRSPD
jgi:hypothetical protein